MEDKPRDPTRILDSHVPPKEPPERVELRDLLEELAMEYDPHLLRQWLEQQEQAERDQELPEQGELK